MISVLKFFSKIFSWLFSPIFKLTKESKSPTDHDLDEAIEKYFFINSRANHLKFYIIKEKTLRLFKYGWKSLIVICCLLFGLYCFFRYTDIWKVKYIFIKEKTVADLKIQKKNIVSINEDSIFNPKLKQMFDFISSTESKSSGDYKAWNKSSDAIGRYQFVPIARAAIGLSSCSREFFFNNPVLQDAAMYIYTKQNDEYFRSQNLYRYVGKTYMGRYISKMGMLSLCHAEGCEFVTRYLQALEQGVILPTTNKDAELRLTFNPDWELNFDKK